MLRLVLTVPGTSIIATCLKCTPESKRSHSFCIWGKEESGTLGSGLALTLECGMGEANGQEAAAAMEGHPEKDSNGEAFTGQGRCLGRRGLAGREVSGYLPTE